MSKREPNFEELVALRDVLIEALPNTCVDDLTSVAVEHAKAVRAAFDELSKTEITE
ncbi:hypothetical protein ACCM60_14180 [Pseudomonas chlororaphis subsp. aureofaciens]|uniref:hypothetical protein n=1 Tax=Pseudomonas chlororaphis TaxID=587753 RepID=UPI0035591A5F